MLQLQVFCKVLRFILLRQKGFFFQVIQQS
jgi:hypothetical protein